MEDSALNVIMDVLRRVVKEKVGPLAGQIDETDEFPWDIWRSFKELGLPGLVVSQEYGGTGLTIREACLAIREIAKTSMSAAALAYIPLFGNYLIELGGTDEQRRRWLPNVASGDSLLAFAITEADSGSDAMAMRTSAVMKDGHFEITGTKQFISFAGVASGYIVVCRLLLQDRPNTFGFALIDDGTPGLSVGKKEKKMGFRGIPCAEVILDRVIVPKDRMLGLSGNGRELLARLLRRTRLAAANWAIGTAIGAFEYVLDYVQVRKQFGRAIFDFQAVQMMLADMYTNISAGIGVIEKAYQSLETSNERFAEIDCSAAKYLASDVAMQVTSDAVQLMGGYGYMKDYPLERMMRDVKALEILEGTSQIQRWTVARNLKTGTFNF